MAKDLTVGLLFETKQRRGTIVISDALGDNKCLTSATKAEFSPNLHSIVSLLVHLRDHMCKSTLVKAPSILDLCWTKVFRGKTIEKGVVGARVAQSQNLSFICLFWCFSGPSFHVYFPCEFSLVTPVSSKQAYQGHRD